MSIENTLITCHAYMSQSISITSVLFIKYFTAVRKGEYEYIVVFAWICIKKP